MKTLNNIFFWIMGNGYAERKLEKQLGIAETKKFVCIDCKLVGKPEFSYDTDDELEHHYRSHRRGNYA